MTDTDITNTQRTHITIQTDVSDVPDPDRKPEAYDQLEHALSDSVNGALYEQGCVGYETRVRIGEGEMSGHTNSEPASEMMPQLSEDEYKTEVGAIAQRTLRRFADDDTGAIMELDTVEIRATVGEIEMFHERFPFSILEHGRHEPNPGAWNWIEDAPPKTSLVRQALDIVAGDVDKRMRELMQFEERTYWEDGTIYLRETFNQSETGNAATEGDDSNDSADGASDNSIINEHAPEWDLPTNEAGEPDYEAAVEQMNLEYDEVFHIGMDFYRYRGHRTDDIVVEPLGEYANMKEDCLPVEHVWRAFCVDDLGHGPPRMGRGMVRGVTNSTGDSHIGLKPSDMGTDSSFARIGLENVPERGAFFVDYRYGEDMPALSLYDATDHDDPAFQFLLPTREHPTVQLVCDRTSPNHILESLPAELRERIENVNKDESERESKSERDGADQ